MTETIHVRTIRIEATRVGEHELEVTGRLVDDRPQGSESWFGRPYGPTIHDMSLTIRVRYPDLVITHVDGGMTAHPYTICRDAVPGLDRLVGISVAQGFTRAINERLGRQRGCAHLTALIHAIAPVVRQGAGAAFRDDGDLPSAERDLWFIDTCQAWRADGPLAARLRAGDVAGLQALSSTGDEPA